MTSDPPNEWQNRVNNSTFPGKCPPTKRVKVATLVDLYACCPAVVAFACHHRADKDRGRPHPTFFILSTVLLDPRRRSIRSRAASVILGVIRHRHHAALLSPLSPGPQPVVHPRQARTPPARVLQVLHRVNHLQSAAPDPPQACHHQVCGIRSCLHHPYTACSSPDCAHCKQEAVGRRGDGFHIPRVCGAQRASSCVGGPGVQTKRSKSSVRQVVSRTMPKAVHSVPWWPYCSFLHPCGTYILGCRCPSDPRPLST